jgi:hypothetical protein
MSERTSAAARNGLVTAVGVINTLAGVAGLAFTAMMAPMAAFTVLLGWEPVVLLGALSVLALLSGVGVWRRRVWGPVLAVLASSLTGLGLLHPYFREPAWAAGVGGYCLLCVGLLLIRRKEFKWAS